MNQPNNDLPGDIGMRETWGGGEGKSLREQLMQAGVNAVRKNESYKRFFDSAMCRVGRKLRHTGCCDRPSRRQHITGCPAL